MNKKELGSKTAKGGFTNEKDVCKKFNNWEKDKEAQDWLQIMGYNLQKIDLIKAIQVPVKIKKDDIEKFKLENEDFQRFIRFKKADIQIRITIKIGNILKIENLSLKKANSNADYNQVDKRKVSDYQDMWQFNDEIAYWLKLFTGEYNPVQYLKNYKLNDTRRLFLNEMPKNIQIKIINFFEKNKIMIVSDILKGRGGLSANWFLVTKYNEKENTTNWILKDINFVMNFFGNEKVKISPKGSLYIGKITMQRKGGTPDPTKLQFKIKPCQLFED